MEETLESSLLLETEMLLESDEGSEELIMDHSSELVEELELELELEGLPTLYSQLTKLCIP